MASYGCPLSPPRGGHMGCVLGPQTLPYPSSPGCPAVWQRVPSPVPSHPGLVPQDLEGDAEVGVLDTHGQGGELLSPVLHFFTGSAKTMGRAVEGGGEWGRGHQDPCPQGDR